jgi:hypothetical protein
MIYQYPPVHAGGFFLLGGRVFPGLTGRTRLRAHDTRRLLRLRKVASGPPTTLSASGLIIAAEALLLALQTITKVVGTTRTCRGGPTTLLLKGRTDMPFKLADVRV